MRSTSSYHVRSMRYRVEIRTEEHAPSLFRTTIVPAYSYYAFAGVSEPPTTLPHYPYVRTVGE